MSYWVHLSSSQFKSLQHAPTLRSRQCNSMQCCAHASCCGLLTHCRQKQRSANMLGACRLHFYASHTRATAACEPELVAGNQASRQDPLSFHQLQNMLDRNVHSFNGTVSYLPRESNMPYASRTMHSRRCCGQRHEEEKPFIFHMS